MPTETTIYDTVKNFCRRLSVYNVERVQCSYNGVGDSGDSDLRFFVRPPANSNLHENPNYNRLTGHMIYYDQQFVSFCERSGIPPVFTQAEFDNFSDQIFEIIPDGWEIEDGSYGNVIVDVINNKITVEHNERFTSVNSSRNEF